MIKFKRLKKRSPLNRKLIHKVMDMKVPDGWTFDMQTHYVNNETKSCCFAGVLTLNGVDDEQLCNSKQIGHGDDERYGLFGVYWSRFDNTLEGALARLLYAAENDGIPYPIEYKFGIEAFDTTSKKIYNKKVYDEMMEPYLARIKEYRNCQ